MTIPRLKGMQKYWEKNPPLHLMVAAYFGLGKSSKPKGDLADLLSMATAV